MDRYHVNHSVGFEDSVSKAPLNTPARRLTFSSIISQHVYNVPFIIADGGNFILFQLVNDPKKSQEIIKQDSRVMLEDFALQLSHEEVSGMSVYTGKMGIALLYLNLHCLGHGAHYLIVRKYRIIVHLHKIISAVGLFT